jgi:hypothetical protein
MANFDVDSSEREEGGEHWPWESEPNTRRVFEVVRRRVWA